MGAQFFITLNFNILLHLYLATCGSLVQIGFFICLDPHSHPDVLLVSLRAAQSWIPLPLSSLLVPDLYAFTPSARLPRWCWYLSSHFRPCLLPCRSRITSISCWPSFTVVDRIECKNRLSSRTVVILAIGSTKRRNPWSNSHQFRSFVFTFGRASFFGMSSLPFYLFARIPIEVEELMINSQGRSSWINQALGYLFDWLPTVTLGRQSGSQTLRRICFCVLHSLPLGFFQWYLYCRILEGSVRSASPMTRGHYYPSDSCFASSLYEPFFWLSVCGVPQSSRICKFIFGDHHQLQFTSDTARTQITRTIFSIAMSGE